MNYLLIIVIFVVILIILDNILDTKKYNIQSSYVPSNNKESIGFIKPEHRLLKLLNSRETCLFFTQNIFSLFLYFLNFSK